MQLAYLVVAAVIAFCSQYAEGAVQHAMLAIPTFMLGHVLKWKEPEATKKSIGPIPPVTMLFALFLVGCGASVYESTLDTINATAGAVTQAQPAVLALCAVDPGERCDDARKAYEVAGAAVAAAHDALEVYRVTGKGLDEVGKALRVAADSAREVANVVASN